VESSPMKKETMTEEVRNRLLDVLRRSKHVKVLDITGGAPEMHSQFRPLVKAATDMGLSVQDRCNLTVLTEPGYEDLGRFLADHKVHVVASLPCYSESNVKKQRGAGVFERSISALKHLNSLGYGTEGSGLTLTLVYNPAGAFLPPSQKALEAAYKERLMTDFGVKFTQLYTMTNMAIKRYVDVLHREGKLEEYCRLLVDNFNPTAADNTMCRTSASMKWDGDIFDCDFNLALDLPRPAMPKVKKSIFDLDSFDDLRNDPIAVGPHCFGCTAGEGSS